MQWFRYILLALAVPLLLGLALGQENAACKNASTTAAMRACENARYQAADRQLNAVYARLMRDLDKPRQDKLRLAQRTWVQFRDANADFLAAGAEGGTLAPLIKVSALADMTEQRTKELMKVQVQ